MISRNLLKTALLLLSVVVTSLLNAQGILGDWNGTLEINPQTKLRLVLHITKDGDAYKTTFDSPDQGANGIPMATTSFQNTILLLTLPAAGIEYKGELNGDKIGGSFKQGGAQYPLQLVRGKIEVESPKRPQEPIPPYTYYSEDISFENKGAGITLAGTLTKPTKEGNYPTVILISGSGRQDRNEELLGHKPFLVLADHLTKQGISVLRYDDRGVAKSTGNFSTATTQDFATDVSAAVSYLKMRSDIKQIGLIGHSEGGMIAPMVAGGNKDISFIVLLAGPGTRCDELLIKQQELIGKVTGQPANELALGKEISKKVFTIINKNKDLNKQSALVTKYLKDMVKKHPDVKPKEQTTDEFIATQIKEISSPWMQYFLRFDPLPYLKKVKCPTYALNGEKDLQVPAQDNLEAIKNGIAKSGNKDITTKMYKDLNHLFQHCTTGSPVEYPTIAETFSPEVLNDVAKWIKERTVKK